MKKTIAIILTILMAASTFTACSQANGVAESSVDGSPETAVLCPPRKNRQKNAGKKPNEKNDKYDIKLLCESAFIPRFA